MAPKRKSIKHAIDDVETIFASKVMKKPVAKSTLEPEPPAEPEPDGPMNGKRVKERWVERNWQGLSKEFQQAWEASSKEKDPTSKDKLLGVIVKGGRAGRNYQLDSENLQEAIKEVRSRSMRSATESYSRSFTVGKVGSESAFEKALTSGETVEVAAPPGSKVPFYSYMSFELAEQTTQEESMGLNRQKGSLGKKELKEVEELLMFAGCWFQSKPKGVANSSHAPWTEEATLAVQKAVQTGNQLIEKLLYKVKAVGKTSTSGMLKECDTIQRVCGTTSGVHC